MVEAYQVFVVQYVSLLLHNHGYTEINKHCVVLTTPTEFVKLIGRKFLFKVEKDAVYGFRFNDSFKVKRICEDDAIIHEFKNDSVPVTPEKVSNQNY